MSSTAERYSRFAREAARRSPIYAAWSEAIALDDELVALIDTLPVADREPLLVLTAARFTGLSPRGDVRTWLEGEWDAVAAVARLRSARSDDLRRTGTLVAALQGIAGPIALLEVGASAGLGLLADRYSHVFAGPEGERRLDPVDGPSILELRCELGRGVPLPARMPDIVWRAGLDRSPLRLDRADDERWLRTLVWPEERTSAAQLDAAIGIAREHPPHLVAADAVDGVAALAAHAPPDATLVVWSPFLLDRFSPPERERFARTARGLPGHWVSLDDWPVVPAAEAGSRANLPGADGDALLSRDGHPLAVVSPRGERIDRWVAAD
ncbi:DUF2332 domain-containing protein [Microcella alkalica]|uniref:DUF2332 domain-containing protein n=1 Tax=Microcella alkalica TaxID=355930 RepID=A0A839E6I7_9MICO|nr:hypothetical protein [Microcella alkalica]